MDADKQMCGLDPDSPFVELAVEVFGLLADATRRWRSHVLPAFGRRSERNCRHTLVERRRRGQPRWFERLVGAIDLVATLIAGSKYEYGLMWCVVVGCIMKIVLVEGAGRYSLASGRTIFEG
mgnify:CR=1 FL=1